MRKLSVVVFSAMLAACTDGGGTTDGGATDGSTDAGPEACTATSCPTDQYCDFLMDPALPMCMNKCNLTTSPTVCTGNTACDPDSGECVKRCDVDGGTACTGSDVCGPDGICETECDDATCLALEQLCVPEENACGDPTTATSCTFATTNSVPSRDADGPILYDATAEDGTSAEDTTNCPGGGYVVFVKAKYRDADGDAETTSLCAFTPVTDSAFFQWNTNDTSGSQGCANQETMDTGSTATEGGFSIPLCFGDPRPADFVFQVKDQAGNDSNPICMALPPI